MNYQTMQTWELLAEKSHMEQLGFNGEVQLLDINEELANRKASTPKEVKYTKNARAIIHSDRVVFYGREGGEKKTSMTIAELYQDTHLLSFYQSEYLTNGIKSRVIATLEG